MPKVLPAIAEEDGDPEPRRRFQKPIYQLGDPHLPRRKAARRATFEQRLHHHLAQHGRLARCCNTDTAATTAAERADITLQVLAHGPGIDAHPRQHPRHNPARLTDPAGPDGDIILLPAAEISRVCEIANGQPERRLHRLLREHGPDHFNWGNTVALLEFRRRVEAVLGEVVFGGDEVEDEGHEPVGQDGEKEGQVEVGEVGKERGKRVQCVGGERRKGGCILVGHGDVRQDWLCVGGLGVV